MLCNFLLLHAAENGKKARLFEFPDTAGLCFERFLRICPLSESVGTQNIGRELCENISAKCTILSSYFVAQSIRWKTLNISIFERKSFIFQSFLVKIGEQYRHCSALHHLWTARSCTRSLQLVAFITFQHEFLFTRSSASYGIALLVPFNIDQTPKAACYIEVTLPRGSQFLLEIQFQKTVLNKTAEEMKI
jgi:hypothetical protein